VALLMALWALALVGVLLPGLLEAGRQQLLVAQLQRDERVALQLMRGGELFVAQALKSRAARTQAPFWQAMRGEVISQTLPEGEVHLQLRDLRSCFNVNALAGPDAELALEQLVHLLRAGERVPGEPSAEALAQRIADWVDGDSLRRADGMESLDALRATPPALVADRPMADIGELDLLQPPRRGRLWLYPQLCALPDVSAWRLNLNALGPQHLPLLDALFTGRVSRALLERLIRARPALGYTDEAQLRSLVGSGASDEEYELITHRLLLNGDRFVLGIEVVVDGRRYRRVRQLAAAGVSYWNPAVPVQRVRLLARAGASLWSPQAGVQSLY